MHNFISPACIISLFLNYFSRIYDSIFLWKTFELKQGLYDNVLSWIKKFFEKKSQLNIFANNYFRGFEENFLENNVNKFLKLFYFTIHTIHCIGLALRLILVHCTMDIKVKYRHWMSNTYDVPVTWHNIKEGREESCIILEIQLVHDI